MELAADLAKLAHIAVAMAMIGGQVGSRLLNRQAASAERIDSVVRLTRAAAPFDRIGTWSAALIIPTGLLAAWTAGYEWLGLTTGWILATFAIIAILVVLVARVFQPDGARVQAEIQAAVAVGEVTPALRASFRPPARGAGRIGMATSRRRPSSPSWS